MVAGKRGFPAWRSRIGAKLQANRFLSSRGKGPSEGFQGKLLTHSQLCSQSLYSALESKVCCVLGGRSRTQEDMAEMFKNGAQFQKQRIQRFNQPNQQIPAATTPPGFCPSSFCWDISVSPFFKTHLQQHLFYRTCQEPAILFPCSMTFCSQRDASNLIPCWASQ